MTTETRSITQLFDTEETERNFFRLAVTSSEHSKLEQIADAIAFQTGKKTTPQKLAQRIFSMALAEYEQPLMQLTITPVETLTLEARHAETEQDETTTQKGKK